MTYIYYIIKNKQIYGNCWTYNEHLANSLICDIYIIIEKNKIIKKGSLCIN